jgi:hypothetical protein
MRYAATIAGGECTQFASIAQQISGLECKWESIDLEMDVLS